MASASVQTFSFSWAGFDFSCPSPCRPHRQTQSGKEPRRRGPRQRRWPQRRAPCADSSGSALARARRSAISAAIGIADKKVGKHRTAHLHQGNAQETSQQCKQHCHSLELAALENAPQAQAPSPGREPIEATGWSRDPDAQLRHYGLGFGDIVEPHADQQRVETRERIAEALRRYQHGRGKRRRPCNQAANRTARRCARCGRKRSTRQGRSCPRQPRRAHRNRSRAHHRPPGRIAPAVRWQKDRGQGRRHGSAKAEAAAHGFAKPEPLKRNDGASNNAICGVVSAPMAIARAAATPATAWRMAGGRA
jgi:hypothetical protein